MAMKEFTELQRTPSLNHVSAQSPRVGGCVGTFFHMFDWNPSKKRCATKRLPAGISASFFFPRHLSESLNHILLELLHESNSRTHILNYRFQSFLA
jgi:hypothetical protein